MTWLKWLGMLLLVVVAGVAGLFGIAWLVDRNAAATVYAVNDPALSIPTDSHALAQGAHLFATRGCADCHAADGAGREVFDAGPVVRVVAPNITPAVLQQRGYDADRIAAAIRHGVRPDGTPLLFMPVHDWHNLGDADTAALVAYMATLPAREHDPGASVIRPLGKVLAMFGRFPAYPAATLDHSPRQRATPEVKVSVEFGRYIAESCTGCHGKNFAGGLVMKPGTPPTANLTPTALANWSEDDFIRSMREGKRPDGSSIDSMMPWQAYSKMTDVELRSLWQFLKRLPAA